MIIAGTNAINKIDVGENSIKRIDAGTFSVFRELLPESEIDPNLLAWYRGEDNLLDSSGNGNTLVPFGTLDDVDFVDGYTGRAFSIYYNIHTLKTPAITLGTSYRVEVIFKPDPTTSYAHLASGHWSTSTSYGALYNHNGAVEYWWGGSMRLSVAAGVLEDFWYKVIFSYNGATQKATIKVIKLADLSETTGTETGTHVEDGAPLIVGIGQSYGTSDSPLLGLIDEVKFFNAL